MFIRIATIATTLVLVAGSLALPGTDANDPDALLQSSAYDTLHDALAAEPGFLGLVPARDGSGLLHAAFSGDAPAVPTALVPSGWDLVVHRNQSPETLRVPVSSVTDVDDLTQAQRDGVPPLPEDAVGLGPGTPILQTIPGEGTFICSANFVFEDGSKVYLGTAGHCVLASGATATHGAGADYDASGVRVQACIDFCYFGGQLQGFFGDMVTLGQVAYARQTGAGGDIGNDFAVVEIPANLHQFVRPEMPMWDGPTGVNGLEGFGSPVVHYGNGIDAGTFMATKGRTGAGLNDGDPKSIQMNILINGGDSGSPINHAWIAPGSDVYEGTAGLGVITHGLIVSAVPLAWGTSLDQALSMATQANLQLSVLLEGETVGSGTGGGGDPVPVHVDSVATSYGHFGNGGHRLETTVTVLDGNGDPAPGVDVGIEVDAAGTILSGAGTTDGTGSVTISVQDKKAPHGTWESCVVNLGGIGYTYDSASNVETCQSQTVA